ncbi:MAG: CoA pyrophosphatase [Rhodoferax sp.]|nr:CoA pyrophosphatase [Rhodoferax sp.]
MDLDGVLDLDHIAAALAAVGPPRRSPLEREGASASAVLAPLHLIGGEPHVVVTRRAQHLRSHRGEVSFPGGRQEPGEDLWTTALREAQEETALPPAAVRPIGELDHLSTVTSSVFIVPFVGVVEEMPELEASPDEVELIRHVSLRELLTDGVYREERWGIGGLDRPIYFFEIDDDTIWGATASMLRDLLSIITGTKARPDGGRAAAASRPVG